MNTTTITEANITAVNKLIKAWGYDGAKHYIVKTLNTQRMTRQTTLIATWEANLAVINEISK
jgi:hypothetical protein